MTSIALSSQNWIGNILILELIIISVLVIKESSAAPRKVKGYGCKSPADTLTVGDEWDGIENDSPGINAVFILQDSQHSWGNFLIQLTQGITQYIIDKTTTRYEQLHSLGMIVFSHNASIAFNIGQKNISTYKHQAEDLLKQLTSMTFQGQGSNVSGALDTVKDLFKVHRGNRIYGRNICFLLITSPPDYASQAVEETKHLQDLGISTIVIGVGTNVTMTDIEDLGSNRNAVFLTHQGDDVTDITKNVTAVLEMASMVARYGMCYEAYRNFYIVVNVNKGHIKIMEQLSKFISQFRTHVSIEFKMVNNQATDEVQHAFRKMRSQNLEVAFKTNPETKNGIDSTCTEFETDSESHVFGEKILIVVTDQILETSTSCEMAGIHVMALGVGTDVDEDHLNRIISDPRGKEVVQDTGDVFWGLQLLNRKLCPGQNWIGNILILELIIISVLVIKESSAAPRKVKEYGCKSPADTLTVGDEWDGIENDSPGINAVFILQDSQHSWGNFLIQLTQGITQYIIDKTTTRYEQLHSLGMIVFSHNASIAFNIGQKNISTYKHQAEDLLKQLTSMTFQGQGSNVSGALDTVKDLFKVHRGNRIYGRNICFLLITSPPDYASQAVEEAKHLQDLGISTIVIGVGTNVTMTDIEDLGSNRNAVFLTHQGDDVTDITKNVTAVLEMARLLPSYGMCYEAYRNLYIMVNVNKGHEELMGQLSNFISQFRTHVSIQIKMMNNPVTDEFHHAFRNMRSQNLEVTFKTDQETETVMESSCTEFETDTKSLFFGEKILIVVTDQILEPSTSCEMAGIHVMALGVGTDVDEDHLNRIISDPRGKEVVQDTGDVFWGLQLLNRKLCPGQNWIGIFFFIKMFIVALLVIKDTSAEAKFEKGYACFTSTDVLNPLDDLWERTVNDDPGINAVFILQNSQHSWGGFTIQLVHGIAEYIIDKTTTKNSLLHSLGMCTFSHNASLSFHHDGGWIYQAEDFFSQLNSTTFQGQGSNVFGALNTVKTLFKVHGGKRIYGRNLCFMLIASAPDNVPQTAREEKHLHDLGISIIVIGVGTNVTRADIEDLGSNRKAVFLTHPEDTTNITSDDIVTRITQNVTSVLKFERLLPRYGVCYEAYRNIYIVVDVRDGDVELIEQLSKFISQFRTHVSIQVNMINNPATDEFQQAFRKMRKQNREVTFKNDQETENVMELSCTEFETDADTEHLVFGEKILIVVTDQSLNASTSCEMAGIHVMALGVGTDVDEDHLNRIISDPRGKEMVQDTGDVFWGLQLLNRKLCPAVCDTHWIYHNGMCYFQRNSFRKNWLDAKEECYKSNARLVSITTVEKFDWLVQQFSSISSPPIYIGLKKSDVGDAPIYRELRWENGEPLMFSNWSHNRTVPEPDGGLYEACVGWYRDGWRDIGCMFTINSLSWICEREANNATKPELVGVQVRPLWEETTCPLFNQFNLPHIEWQTILISGPNCSPVYDVIAFAGTSYMEHTFNCSNGELTSILLHCDGVEHCTDASDEKGCTQSDTCADSQFRCDNERCVSLAYVCDFWDDCGDNSDETTCVHSLCPHGQCDNGQCYIRSTSCDLNYDCLDKSDEQHCFGKSAATSCNDGTIIPNSWRKDGIVDCTGATKEDEAVKDGIPAMDLCYTGRYKELYYLVANKKYEQETTECTMMFDGYGKHWETSDMSDCYGKSTICPIGFYLCPSGFCIPIERVCDGKMDCIHGEEEVGCENYVCPGYFRCPGTNTCFHPALVCNGEIDCPGGRDEVLCHVTCSHNCTCQGGLVQCHHQYNFSSPLPPSTKKLVLKKQFSNYMKDALKDLRYLIEVDYSGIDLNDISGVFDSQVNLKILNLSRNSIDEISKFVFVNLESLNVLDLSHNLVQNIKANSFSGLRNLKELYINNNRFSKLSAKSFTHLVKLEYLNVKDNLISLVESGAFTGLAELNFLHMEGNAIYQFDKGVYNGLVRIREIHTDAFTLCCPKVRPPSVKEDNCVAPKQSISSCEDLMANDFLRASIWVLCISALVGNIVTIGMRSLLERESMRNGFGVFVTHLSVSDFLMGVYLLIIAVADTKYKGIYTWNDYDWRNSVYCKLAGFLATLSSEASAMFIFLITLDRFLVMKFPFGQVRFRFKSATVCSICAWLIGVVFAAVPLMPSLEDWRFYSKNGACLALPFFTERVPGWLYSSLIFIGFNFVIFIFIAVGQFIIYRTIKNASMISSKKRMEQEMAIARRLFLIVLTDFLCWFPIGVMGLLALSGTEIQGEVYAWTAVFVLPVNSALNPFLYTIPAVMQKLRSKTKCEKTAQDVTLSTGTKM